MTAAADSRLSLAGRVAMWIATGFGAGRIPRAPGTAGSLVAVALYVALDRAFEWAGRREDLSTFVVGYAAAAVLLAAAGVWAAASAARQLGAHDPQSVVIDEISGQWIAFAPLAAGGAAADNWTGLVLAFVLFRVFDIWKPPPVRRAERLPSGWGIMADDWLAGVYAAVFLYVIQLAGP